MTEQELAKERGLDGFIHTIAVNGKKYGLKCEVITVRPISCSNCGGAVELKYGEGICKFCGTHYSTKFYVEES